MTTTLRRLLLVVALALASAQPAPGAVFNQSFGSFSPLTAISDHTDSLSTAGYEFCVFQMVNDAGTFTAEYEVSIDAGLTWDNTPVASTTSTSRTFYQPQFTALTIHPGGATYRLQVTACAGCSVVMRWRCER